MTIEEMAKNKRECVPTNIGSKIGWMLKAGLTASIILGGLTLISGNGKTQQREDPGWQLTKITSAKRYKVEREGYPFYHVYVDEEPFGSLDYVEGHGAEKNTLYPWSIDHPGKEQIDYFETIKQEGVD